MSLEHVPDYVLPPSLIGHGELARMIREVEAVDGSLQAQKVRAEGQPMHMPEVGPVLQDFIEQNHIDLSDGKTVLALKEHLRTIKDHAPVVHMTFAVEADNLSLQKLASWLREEIHPYSLITVGLQPSLVGGVYLRTPNKVHDFTLKALLKGKRDIIVKELEQLRAR
jgi:F0F1-type ATP synthase delta subunit